MKKILKFLISAVAFIVIALLVASDLFKTDYKTHEKSAVAMGTVVSACIYGGDEKTAQDIIASIEETEKLISRNIADSCVSLLNKNGQTDVNGDVAYLFRLCKDVCSRSDGCFDITTGELSSLWDIGGEKQRIPQKNEIEKALEKVDGTSVSVSNNTVKIKKGQTVDLGAAGKGFAADRAFEILEKSGVKGAVVSVGGSILLYGRHNPSQQKWSVAVRDPFGSSSDYAGVLELSGGYISTSGDYERYFEKNGKRYHHILSPFDGYPVDNGLKSVTIVADEGAVSDILSTACFVMDLKDGMKLADGLGVQAVFIDKNKNVYLTDGLKNCFHLCSDEFNLAEYEKD
ncbi:MAG: FAD:protein FMN transferase [Clostridia bacterium]|nr:FAD:protein FMN transferase [Clostridia bacterium]